MGKLLRRSWKTLANTTLVLWWCIIFLTSVGFGTYLAFSSSYRLHRVHIRSYSGNSTTISQAHESAENNKRILEDSCRGKRVHIYDLPPKFNSEILEKCNKMVSWLSFCEHFINHGFGTTTNASAWYRTDPYMLDVIFHERMKRYRCRVDSPELADLFFVPYYAGLDALRFLYGESFSKRQEQGLDLVKFLDEKFHTTWTSNYGHDHFIVTGRTAWDFTSYPGNSWGTGLRLLKEIENVTSLLMERRPWISNEQAVPYPTSFHPCTRQELDDWIRKVQYSSRVNFLTFIGAMRPHQKGGIRRALLDQCINSTSTCQVVDCSKLRCTHDPILIAEKLVSSVFCLQPKGDTATRRSTFDSLISGCIPVFFHVDSAYTQYTWHLPNDPDSYSVFIAEDEVEKGMSVEEYLRRNISAERIAQMQRNIWKLIPRLLFLHPHHSLDGVEDAFDVSLTGMINKFSSWKTQA